MSRVPLKVLYEDFVRSTGTRPVPCPATLGTAQKSPAAYAEGNAPLGLRNSRLPSLLVFCDAGHGTEIRPALREVFCPPVLHLGVLASGIAVLPSGSLPVVIGSLRPAKFACDASRRKAAG